MAKKDVIQIFEDWQGVDFHSSDLTRDGKALLNALNYQRGQGNSLVGRRGYQVDGPKGGFRGGHVYSYLNTTSGATEEEVLAVNDRLWKRVTASVTITYVGGGVTTWYYQVKIVGGEYVFDLTTVTPPTSGVARFNLGTGTADEPFTIKDLIDGIDALSDFTCSGPSVEYAKVNGAQTAVSVITVDAGHTFAVGDYAVFYDHTTANPRLTARIITATTGTTLTFNSAFGTVAVKDNQVIGPLASPAATIRVSSDTNNAFTGVSTVDFTYWEPVKFNYVANVATAPLEFWASTADDPILCSFVNANDVCYIGQSRRTVALEAQSETDPDGKLLKYDGNRIYRAGMIEGGFSSFTPGAGTATYRYLVTREHTDHRGNIVEGNPSPISTQASAALSTSCVITNIQSSTNSGWFNTAGAIINGNQSSATTLTVDSGHTLRAGDIVSIYDAVTGGIVRRTLTSVTATTLVWAATTSITVIDNMAISCGLINKIWRTKDNGVDFYFVIAVPNDAFAGTTTVTDSVADASLAIKYEFPLAGEEHDVPGAWNYLCLHQGCLVGAGDRGQPNTVGFSLPGQLEYWPIATNQIDVPSTIRGPITGIASDADNRLAVFKQNAFYDVEGDLETAALTVTARNEGDFGVISHASLALVEGTLMGVSLYGPVVIGAGKLSSLVGRAIRPKFTQQGVSGTIVSAVGVLDGHNRMYRFWLNEVSGAATVGGFVFQYDTDTAGEWFPWTYSATVRPRYGMLVSSDDLWNVGAGQFFRELNYVAADDAIAADHYQDNTAAINYVLKTTPFHKGRPRLDKQFTRLVLYSLDSEFEDDYAAFTTTIKTYRNRSSSAHTSTTKTFAGGDTNYDAEVLLKNGKARMLSVELQTNTIGERPLWNGLELTVVQAVDEAETAE